MSQYNVIDFPGKRPRRPSGTSKVFCIPCAVGNHDFRQRCPVEQGISYAQWQSVKAWINGRSYELHQGPGAKVICVICGREIESGYMPEEPQ